MSQDAILKTKLYAPPARPEMVSRPRLLDRLDAGLTMGDGFARALTVVSAPAGFGKTTLVSEWVHALQSQAGAGGRSTSRVAWLSLDQRDNDQARFLTYLIAAFRTLAAGGSDAGQAPEGLLGQGVLGQLQAPQPPPAEVVMTTLINDLAAFPPRSILVLDDYHLIDAREIHDALGFLLEHLPPGIHLVMATREDPPFPLARLRARGQLVELRATDLRFTPAEASEFLNQAMGLELSAKEIDALETRTEGWIAGLQLAALALLGSAAAGSGRDVSSAIRSFTGSHRYVLDYLVEEVLEQQSPDIQTFLLRTSILDRLCGHLCEAVCFGSAGSPERPAQAAGGQETLEFLDRANLFIVPLDDERRWYRYHHLFADLLRQRLQRATASTPKGEAPTAAELHRRASRWYEENGLVIEAFYHATAAQDVKRATRLIEGGGMPLTFRAALAPVLNWLESLPVAVLDANPLLWVTHATAILATGQGAGVEEKLKAAEAALQGVDLDPHARDLVGRIAATRATLAWGQDDAGTIVAQSRRALEYLHPDNLPFRTSTNWKLGYAYWLQGDRAAARQAYRETIAACEASGNVFIHIMGLTGLGDVQLAENQLHQAADSYRRILQMVGNEPLPVAVGAHVGLGVVSYEWNDLGVAEEHGERAVQLARNIDSNDAPAAAWLLAGRLSLAQNDLAGATANLAEAAQYLREHNFVRRMPAVVAAQVRVLLYQGDVAAAADLAEAHRLPLSQARVHLARGDTSAALDLLRLARQEAEASGAAAGRIEVMILQAVALQAHGQQEEAVRLLGDALALAEPGGSIRTFVDEGPPMARLLQAALAAGIAPEYTRRLLAAFPTAELAGAVPAKGQLDQSHLVEPLSERELELLQLIAEGLSNREIASRLYLSVNTVKAHTRNIYGKLGVNSRTQAVARARELGILLPW